MRNFREAFTQLERCLTGRMQAYHTPALVMALTDRIESIHVAAYGKANLETGEEARPDHLFALGSVGKSFTAVAALQAKEAGLLDFRAPVQQYLPWFEVRSAHAPITAHHLLTHTSGLPRGTEFSPDPRAEVYAVRDIEVGFAPGRHFSYSDLGYKVLGLVLEAVTGKTYEALIREKILGPLEMSGTHAVTTSSLRPCMAAGYRHLYDDRPQHPSHPLVPADWVETNSGDGCILSTAEDVAKFARMLLNEGAGPHGQVISESSCRKMFQPMIDDEGETYGYGLYLFEDEGYQIAGHGGDVPGFQSYMWLDLDNGLGAITLMSEPYTPRASLLNLEFFRAAYLGYRLPDTPPLPDFTHVKDPAQYVGLYQSDGGTLAFEAAEHHLLMLAGDQSVVLEERSGDCFYANHPDWNLFLLQFERGERGEVTGVSYGPQWFAGQRDQGERVFETPAAWAAYAGHYRSHNPWETNFRVYARKGQLFLCSADGEEEVLTPLPDGSFRIGEDNYLPERLAFDQIVDGQALRATRSTCEYYRFFTP